MIVRFSQTLAALAVLLAASSAPAAFTTTTYSFAGLTGVTASVAATSQPSGGSFSNITRSGLTAVSASNGYNSSGFTVAGRYLTFTITAGAGNTTSLGSLDFFGFSSGTGPTSIDVRSSVDGFAATLLTAATTTSSTNSGREYTINFTSPLFANLTTPVEFRIFGTGASNVNGTFRLDNTLSVSANFAPLGGTAVPEPASVALLGVSLVGVLVASRRRQAIPSTV